MPAFGLGDRGRSVRKRSTNISNVLERFSQSATRWSGSSAAFAIACAVIVVWGVSGPLFGFSDTWQLVINTGTTIVTFLMVFLIQRSQNKDSMAVQLKLNELVAAIEGASNRLIVAEDLCEEDLETLHGHYQKLAGLAAHDAKITESHSIDEAKARHDAKTRRRRRAS